MLPLGSSTQLAAQPPAIVEAAPVQKRTLHLAECLQIALEQQPALAAHGHARRAPEAPFEYAARAFAELGLAREALDRFAALYEWARFSVNQVTPGMREEALDRLLSVRESIRVGT